MSRAERFVLAFRHLQNTGRAITQKAAARTMGTTPPNFSSAMKGDDKVLTDSFISRFCEAFDEISYDWLLTGEGEMLVNTDEIVDAQPEDVTIVPLLPIAAQAGSLSYFAQSVQLADCERVISPIKGADYAMRVAGDSMSPEYPNGSQVLIKKINPDRFIEWGKVFVLDTCNGTVLKQLAPGKSDDTVTCLSLNPSPVYAPFQVYRDDIIGIYRVLLCMSIK